MDDTVLTGKLDRVLEISIRSESRLESLDDRLTEHVEQDRENFRALYYDVDRVEVGLASANTKIATLEKLEARAHAAGATAGSKAARKWAIGGLAILSAAQVMHNEGAFGALWKLVLGG